MSWKTFSCLDIILMLFLTRGKSPLARTPEENRINSLRGIRCTNSKEDVQTRTTNFQWQEILFPLVTRVVVEGTSRGSGMGKETAWLENVQRLAGSCLDRGFRGSGTARGPGEGERMPPWGKEWRRRRDLPKEFSLPSRPQTERWR